jgi:hypothetical protein
MNPNVDYRNLFIIFLSSIVPVVIAFVHANYYGKKIRNMEKKGELDTKKKKNGNK